MKHYSKNAFSCMMMSAPTIILVLTATSVSAADVTFTKHTIDVDFDDPWTVRAADVDGDGDLDVLGAANFDNDITWWENVAGDGSAWIEHTVDTFFERARGLHAADVDGDGDIDILGAAANHDLISWWENVAGDGSSWTEHAVASAFDSPNSVYAADVDGDGDLDILGTASAGDDITWWENVSGDGLSWITHTIDGFFNAAISVFATDVDNDGDIDVLGAATNTFLTWWENDTGDGSTWIKRPLETTISTPHSVFGADVDGDGDIDVLDSTVDNVAWWENVASDGTSWIEHVVDNSFASAWTSSVYAADVDGDGDLDVLAAASVDHEITWWENTVGDGSDWIEHTLDSDFLGASSVYAVDLDGDGDIDVLGAARAGDVIAWWENETLPPVGAVLTIPTKIPAAAGKMVHVPINLATNGQDFSSIAFAIDFDETCLTFDPSDADFDGIPDAFSFQVPAGFTQSADFDPSDSDGELDVSIFSLGPPFETFSTGTIATVTFTSACFPAPGQSLLAPLVFSSDPLASFGDSQGQSVGGSTVDGSVEISPRQRGDCNADDVVDAADLIACQLEFFDGDGIVWTDTPGGTFAGSPVGCDANADTRVDAGDLSCKNRLIFGLGCAAAPIASATHAPSAPTKGPALSLPARFNVTARGTVVAPIHFSSGKDAINSLAFALEFDRARLELVPAGVRFLGTQTSVQWWHLDTEKSSGELTFVIADLVAAPQTLAEGPLVELEFRVLTALSSVHAGVNFSREVRASFGDLSGRSIPGTAELDPLLLFADGFESGDTSSWMSTVQ